MIVRLAAFLVFFGSSTVYAETFSADVDNFAVKDREYNSCVLNAADEYSESTESADVAAEGALGKCSAKKLLLLGSMNGLDHRSKEEMGGIIDSQLKRQAISTIINKRNQKWWQKLF